MEGKEIPAFAPGDTVVVQVKVIEGGESKRERLQAFEGIVIAIRRRGLNSAFTVRKISHGEGVERTFQMYSPQIGSIKVKRRGNVNRAKLYYLRELQGRKARIQEKLKAFGLTEAEIKDIAASAQLEQETPAETSTEDSAKQDNDKK